MSRNLNRLNALPACLALAACGGSGGHIASAPNPPVTPTPSPTPTPVDPLAAAKKVTIFAGPTPQTYASRGLWTQISGDGVTTASRITQIESAPDQQPVVRYNQGGYYEVNLPSFGFGPLVPTGSGIGGDLKAGLNSSFYVGNSNGDGYTYSKLADWSSPDNDFAYNLWRGSVAFGVPTAPGAVPTTGSATYAGTVTGLTDIVDMAVGGANYLPAFGSVTLDFNFAAGALSGQMALQVPDGMNPRDIGTFTFTGTNYASGSTSYSGAFISSAPGFNFFDGQFTGPAAQELIGRWAVPFNDNGANHQAFGAWIAKR